MPRNMSRNGLADPSKLKPIKNRKDETVQVILETPRGSRNKYSFNDKQKVFEVKRVLPAGMTFPWDFGFVPSTLAEDGDPVDALVLMDEPGFPGSLVHCRLIGVIEGEQLDGKERERNDRLVTVEAANHQWANIQHVDDLGKKFVKELEEFFVNYHNMEGKKYRVLDVRGPGRAWKCIQKGMKAKNGSRSKSGKR